MRRSCLWGLVAAFAAIARAPCGGAQAPAPPADPEAWINEVDLKGAYNAHVYIEVLIRKLSGHAEVPINGLQLQFYSAGGHGSHRHFTATADPVTTVTDRAGSTCTRSPYPTQWCIGTDDDLFTIRWAFIDRAQTNTNTQLPNHVDEWALALCKSDGTLLDFVASAARGYTDTAVGPTGQPTGACGAGFTPTAVVVPAVLPYPVDTATGAMFPTASIGRYGMGNEIAALEWGAYTTISKESENAGECMTPLGTMNPACAQTFGAASAAPPPPPAGAATPPPPPTPTDATVCSGHFPDCEQTCDEVHYEFDVAMPAGGWPDGFLPGNCVNDDGLPVRAGTLQYCRYGQGQCTPPGCTMAYAPHGGQLASCAGTTAGNQRCTIGCGSDYYRVALATEEPLCDCTALRSVPDNCNMAWSNSLGGGAGCPPTDECSWTWPVGYHGDILIADTGEGFCSPLTQCDYTSHYLFQDATRTTADPSSELGAWTSDRVCLPLTDCNVYYEYQSVEPVAGAVNANRQCLPLSVCSQSQYESVPPVRTAPGQPAIGNRQCAPLKQACLSNEYESAPPERDPEALAGVVYLTNRICLFCSTCGMDQYIRTVCTDHDDTDCAPLTRCAAGDIEVAGSAVVDDSGLTHSTNRQCARPTGPCGEDEYESQREIAVRYQDTQNNVLVEAQPRVCASRKVCLATEYEPLFSRARQCSAMQSDSPSIYCDDRECLPLTTCPDGKYTSVPPLYCIPGNSSSGNCGDQQCDFWRATCSNKEFQVTPPSRANNRVCVSLQTCVSGQYARPPPQGSGNQYVQDRQCVGWSPCLAGQYQYGTGPTAAVDRQCRPWSVCEISQFASHDPLTSNDLQPGGWSIVDRHCQSLHPTCQPFGDIPGAQFEIQAPTPTSNRICRPAKAACATFEFETSSPAWNADRGCTPLRVCAADEHQSVAPTGTSDRQCVKGGSGVGGGDGGDDSGDDGGGSGGTIAAVIMLLGGGGAGGGVMWQKQQQKKKGGLLEKSSAPEEIELDDFK